ncbi:hypothetical protein DSCO28_70880 [Desulfosarcina ovata subsp. sediminis]|uniref:Dockerin domain-containing protein n=1 Tax=Desulfosarcina ovata subsp. sediminis TaxID=885957 RepID=A0A5K8A1U9_9BACT|nr:dockerin type I domain-containing protein [Desulfosarcina ovata]BBO86522.1 hypothetical protein DSCO28_70880 [Desulfosarcina ovata subsp. sediminis]
MKLRFTIILVAALCVVLAPALPAVADDFADYDTAAGTTGVVDLPGVEDAYGNVPTNYNDGAGASWFTATDFFPDGTVAMIDSQFEAEGRLIAATGKNIYLQRTYGSSEWDLVATVYGTMDPSFIHVSPDGNRIALGAGYGAPLAIIDTTALSVSDPPLLWDSSNNPATGVTLFPEVNFYDGDWADNRYFVINGGSWPEGCEGPPYDDCTFVSGVGVVDTQNADPTNYQGEALITSIPGASADVEVDASGNIITGIGYGTNTGELRIWSSSELDPSNPPATALTYTDNTKIVLEGSSGGPLSGAYLGNDADGNLTVGGGNYVSTPQDLGYAALIHNSVVTRVLGGGAAVDNSNTSEWKELQPDPCANDSATGILYGSWSKGMAVMWNPYSAAGSCATNDLWGTGVLPRLTIYYPGSAPDSDGDGIPDASDNAYLTANAGQEDTDGDGYGNAADADFNNDGTVNYTDLSGLQSVWGSSDGDSIWDANMDMNSDGSVNYNDMSNLQSHWGEQAPFY